MIYEITAEMHLRNFIDESREVAQALNELADNLQRIEEKYAEKARCSMDKSIVKTLEETLEEVKKSMCDDYCKYSNMEHDNDDWVFEKGSPCEICPLNRL